MRDTNIDTTEPEIGSFAEQSEEKSDVTKTGTTTVGLTTDDGVVVATDRRASLGGRFVSSKNIVKVEQVHPSAVITLVGSVGGAQSFADNLRAETSLYEARRGNDLQISELAKLAGNFARGGPFMAIRPILGGVDEDGSHVFSIDPAGGLVGDDYTVTGSGMQPAYGVLEQQYDQDLSVDEARQVAANAVETAAERDTASGNGLAIATVTENNVDIEKFSDFPDEV